MKAIGYWLVLCGVLLLLSLCFKEGTALIIPATLTGASIWLFLRLRKGKWL